MSDRTIETNAQRLDWLIKFLFDPIIGSITPDLVQSYYSEQVRRGRKSAGVRIDYRHHHAAFAWAVKKEYLKLNPADGIELPRVPRCF